MAERAREGDPRYAALLVSFLLITNDDGVDSPALLPLAREIAKLAPIRVVVPDAERSWVGKAISRFEELRTREVRRAGLDITLVSGSPADCANLAVHTLFQERPLMVIAGVNVGLNTGSGFFLSSGTVGAAMEGSIAGLPALAFSLGVPGNDKHWKRDAKSAAWRDTWQRAAEIAADVVATVRERGFPPGVDLLNVNFDVKATVDTPRVVTHLARVGYDRLFVPTATGRFAHDYGGEIVVDGSLAGSDVALVREGRVSITPVRLLESPELSDALRRALERRSP